jgi:hypothetical protein
MSEQPIWHVPLLILAGIAAIFGVAVGILAARGTVPEPWGTGLLWTFASASLTFTTARIWHARAVGWRELELILFAGAMLYLSSFVFVPPR